MLYLVDSKGVYSPEAVKLMATAFDRVCKFLPTPIGDNNEVRQQCAWTIIRLFDQGQQDPALLFELTLQELTGVNYVASAIPKHLRVNA